MRKVVFVVDGGREAGMGHVQQAITLADELRERIDACFLTKSDQTVVEHIRKAGYDVHQLDCDEKMLDFIRAIHPDAVIIDKIDENEAFARALKEDLQVKLVIFTNLTKASQWADVSVLADYGSNLKNIKYLDERTNTVYFYGPKYWLLRREFCDRKKCGRESCGTVGEITLLFGGSDPLNLTSVVLEELLKLDRPFGVNVILGAHFEHKDALNQVITSYSGAKAKVKMFKDIPNVADLMCNSDLVITSPGLSLFEALCVGTPVIIFPQNEIQKKAYRGLLRILDKEEINNLGGMIDHLDFVRPEEEQIREMEIGEGKQEIIDEILRLCERTRDLSGSSQRKEMSPK